MPIALNSPALQAPVAAPKLTVGVGPWPMFTCKPYRGPAGECAKGMTKTARDCACI